MCIQLARLGTERVNCCVQRLVPSKPLLDTVQCSLAYVLPASVGTRASHQCRDKAVESSSTACTCACNCIALAGIPQISIVQRQGRDITGMHELRFRSSAPLLPYTAEGAPTKKGAAAWYQQLLDKRVWALIATLLLLLAFGSISRGAWSSGNGLTGEPMALLLRLQDVAAWQLYVLLIAYCNLNHVTARSMQAAAQSGHQQAAKTASWALSKQKKQRSLRRPRNSMDTMAG